MVFLRLLVLTAVVWAVQRTLRIGLADLGKQHWQFQPGWLILSGLLYLVSMLPCGIFWHRVLRAMGQDARLGETLRAYYIGHLGKYVPGKALVVVLRAGLIRSHRVDTTVAAVSVFFETFTMMAVGAFVSAAILAAGSQRPWFLLLVALAAIVVVGLPTLPPVFRWLIRFPAVARRNPAQTEWIARLGYRTLLTGWVLITGGWFTMGVSLWAAHRGLGVGNPELLGQWAFYTACVSLATVIGFVSMIPGGLGVRDVFMAQLLVPHFGASVALVIAVVLRLVWLVAEVIISGILYFLGPRPSSVVAADEAG
jgi:uncharacterized membrane protein YbhN (UPF0104 family)